MGDALVRAVATLVAIVSVVATALIGRRRRRRDAVVTPLDLTGVDGRVLFFSDALCRRCDIVRRRLQSTGAAFTEISYSEDAEVHRRVGVTGVPLIVVRGGDGGEVVRLAGVVGLHKIETAVHL